MWMCRRHTRRVAPGSGAGGGRTCHSGMRELGACAVCLKMISFMHIRCDVGIRDEKCHAHTDVREPGIIYTRATRDPLAILYMYTPIKPYLWDRMSPTQSPRERAHAIHAHVVYPTVLRRVHAHAAVRMYNKLVSPTRL